LKELLQNQTLGREKLLKEMKDQIQTQQEEIENLFHAHSNVVSRILCWYVTHHIELGGKKQHKRLSNGTK
jgi:hypothetical protein